MRRTDLWLLLLRGAVFAWAAFFLILGVRGLIDPAVYVDTLGVTLGDMVGKSTIRADLSAFFIVSSVFAAIGALPGRGRRVDWLIVPAACSAWRFWAAAWAWWAVHLTPKSRRRWRPRSRRSC